MKKITAIILAVVLLLGMVAIPTSMASADTGDWVDSTATGRQTIVITNPTATEFTDIPVRVALKSEYVGGTVNFYADGSSTPLAYELESGTGEEYTYAWVKVPELKANDDTTIAVYYGGTASGSSDSVWDSGYELVEHFADSDFSTDSTGRASGTVTGTLACEDSEAAFDGTQKITYAEQLSGAGSFMVSAVISAEENGSWIGIATRDLNGGLKTGDTLFLGINKSTGSLVGRVYGDISPSTTYEVSGALSTGDHLVTLSYTGTNLDLYIDGVKVSTKAAVAGNVQASSTTPLVLGAYSDAALTNAFKGTFDEIQMGTTASNGDLEAFKYAMLLGDAVVVSPLETNSGTDGWADSTAARRQVIVITNPTATEFTDIPVRVALKSEYVGGTVNFYADGSSTPLAYELESGTGDEYTYAWVKVPELKAGDDTTIAVYYGGTASGSSDSVWDLSYELVEHFADSDFSTDSTGRASGTVTGTLACEDSEAAFDGTQKITYAEQLSGAGSFTVSAVISAEENGSWIGIASRDKNGGVKTGDTFFLGISQSANSFLGRVYGDISPSTTYEVSGALSTGDHLVTLSYTGTNLDLYIDGVKVSTKAAVAGNVQASSTTPLVLGAYSDEALTNAFKGTFDEVQMGTTASNGDLEAFKYAMLLGGAVTVNPIEAKDGGVLVTISAPAGNQSLETGSITVSGYINRSAEIFVSLDDGLSKSCGVFEAGNYSFNLSVYGVGSHKVAVTAVNSENSADSASETVHIQMVDTTAPEAPVLSQQVEGDRAVLSAAITQADAEHVTAAFYGQQTLELSEDNTRMFEGSTSSTDVNDVSPDVTATNEVYGTTSSDSENPYQIYKIQLDSEHQAADRFIMSWTGSSDREIGIYVYNYADSTWSLLETGYGDDEFTIDFTIENENVISGGEMTLLVWRSLNSDIAGRESYIAADGQYDFSLLWTTDTQFYSETASYTPLLTQQFNWVIDNFSTLKAKMFINTGDLVNVAGSISQWETISAAYELIEAADIPFSVITGNHDIYNNDTVSYNTYFPVSRIMEDNPYSYGNYNDNYYYLINESGAKIMLLALGMKWQEDDLQWANQVLSEHQDYTAILLVHDYLTVNGSVELNSSYADVKALHDDVVATNENLKLILCGHNHGANTNLEYFGDRAVYTVLADYQSLAYGGLGYLRLIKFDVENNLIYFNTYSDYNKTTEYFTDKQADKDGLYQKNKDEFVISLDLNADKERSFTTSDISMALERNEQISTSQTQSGSGTATVTWKGLEAGMTYSWYVILTDEGGNTTESELATFTTAANTDELEGALADAQSYLGSTLYTPTSMSALADAVADAEAGLSGGHTHTQEQIDTLTLALKNAIAALVFKDADYAAVLAALGKVPTDLSGYTDASVQALTDAKNAVVYGYDIRRQTDVDTMAAQLETAIAALKEKEQTGGSGGQNGNSGNDGSVQTGDNGNTAVWLLAALGSAGAAAFLYFRTRRRTDR